MKKYLISIGLLLVLIFSGCTTPKVAKNSTKSGMFSYMADAAMFVECGTNKRFPVAFVDDYISLEKAYLKTVQEAGKAVKINVEGEIVLRDGMDGKVDVPTLIVKKFINIVPKEVCQNPKSEAKLTNTYWKVTVLKDKAVPYTKPNTREAYMILSNGKVKGNSGCNGLGGAYTLDRDKLSFSDKGFVSTMMFCEGSIENEFLSALREIQRYELKGEYLEVFDKNDNRLIRFESVYLY
jgi:copper homeostasis protein (lipoprotein)